jgi:urease accessory protein
LRADPRVSCSDVDGGVVARVAGASVEEVGRVVRGLLAALPGMLGDDPFARKW